jgi:hypothetical protein
VQKNIISHSKEKITVGDCPCSTPSINDHFPHNGALSVALGVV